MLPENNINKLDGQAPDSILLALGSRREGLTAVEVGLRTAQYGYNEFFKKERARPLRLLLSKFKNPILVTLLVAAGISILSGAVVSSVVILVMVVLSASIDFLNAFRSEKAVEELQKQVRVTATVLRGNKPAELPVRDIVPGDILNLAAGDLVPADCMFIEGRDLFLSEATITGESMPVEKNPGMALWMGTSIVSGFAQAVVAETGKNTRMGSMAESLAKIEAPTAFDLELRSFSVFLFRSTLSVVFLILLSGALVEHRSFFELILFAVAIAVGIAPELLPMIISANLARGAVRMSRSGVIVRKLSAIHDLGSVDILATDKTGTLTEDRITLIRALDTNGEESRDVFLAGYLSSVFLSGVRGTMDKAIVEHQKESISGWEKLDELPFDYDRRRDSVVVCHKDDTGTDNLRSFDARRQPVLITKGAPESVAAVCAFFGFDSVPLSAEHAEAIRKQHESLSADGLRVLGLAARGMSESRKNFEVGDEKEMTFLGFLAFMDPPKKSAKDALRKMIEHGIAIKVITGDHRLVAQKIATELELKISGIISGEEINGASDTTLRDMVHRANIFARVTPEQKERIISALRSSGHVVAYLGDGVNDLLSLRAADVGISVNNAVDVAKDAADIILLRKGLDEIIEGVLEGRKTFANIFKYLMMALSSNFGNMFSMPIGSLFLPFLPMTASQILLNNLLYDTSQLAIPFDRVDKEFLNKPKKFSIKFLKRFMMVFGPLSSVFDVCTYVVFFSFVGATGTSFQTAWFLESMATQILVVNLIRTRQPIYRSRPSRILFLSSVGAVVLAWFLPITPLGRWLNLVPLPWKMRFIILGIVTVYLVTVEVAKYFFYRAWGHLVESGDNSTATLLVQNA